METAGTVEAAEATTSDVEERSAAAAVTVSEGVAGEASTTVMDSIGGSPVSAVGSAKTSVGGGKCEETGADASVGVLLDDEDHQKLLELLGRSLTSFWILESLLRYVESVVLFHSMTYRQHTPAGQW